MRQATRRTVLVIAGAAALQLTGFLVYRAVERRRARELDASFAADKVEPPKSVPRLFFEDVRGNAIELKSHTRRPVLLHFWATWCAPCRTELPSLLAHARSADPAAPELVLVSSDENWDVIRHYFEGAVPPQVVRDVTHAGARELGVETLPETFVLRPPGTIVARVRGARNWRTEEARRVVATLARPDP